MSLYNQYGGEGYIKLDNKIGQGGFGIVFKVACKEERKTKPCDTFRVNRYSKCYMPDYSDFITNCEVGKSYAIKISEEIGGFEEDLLQQISEARKELLDNDGDRDKPAESPLEYLNYIINKIPIRPASYLFSKKHKFISFLEKRYRLKIKSVFLQPLYTISLIRFLDISSHYKNLTENILEKIINDLCKGLYYLHSQLGWIHYDIKSENIMLTINNITIIATYIDYGFSRPVGNEPGNVLQGTYRYMAPEILTDSTSIYGVFSDIWALGIVYCEILLYKHDRRKWTTQFNEEDLDTYISYMEYNNNVLTYYSTIFLDENMNKKNITINGIEKTKHEFLNEFLVEYYDDRATNFRNIFSGGIKDTNFKYDSDDLQCIEEIKSRLKPAASVLPLPRVLPAPLPQPSRTQYLGGKKKSKKRTKRTKKRKRTKRKRKRKSKRTKRKKQFNRFSQNIKNKL